MRRLGRFILPALAVALAAGCEDRPAADIADSDTPEPGDPAVYAPDGWPLKIGDRISDGRRFELESQFPSIGGMEAIHVIGGQAYGARFTDEDGLVPDDDWARGLNPGYRERMEAMGLADARHFVYAGHFPERVPQAFRENEHRLPRHLHGHIEYEEIRVLRVGPSSKGEDGHRKRR